jgi:hypothetical protein
VTNGDDVDDYLGSLFIVAAPSGAGKSTLVNELLANDPVVKLSISYTTRSARSGESDGREYFFIDVDTLEHVGGEVIIGVEEAEQLARRGQDARVPRRREPGVFFVEVADPPAIPRRHLAGVVGRSIIHHDHLDPRIGLRQDAVQGTLHTIVAVEDRDYDGDQRIRHD